MKNYSIIEDLAPDHWQNINLKNHPKALQDCIKRNLFLIRRYFKGSYKPTLGIFKKILLPGYIQEFNSQILSSKNRFSQSSVPKHNVLQEISQQIIPSSLSTLNEIQPVVEKLNKVVEELEQFSRTQPSVKLIQKKTKLLNSKILSLLENFDSSQNQQNKLPLEEKNKPIFHVRSPRKMVPVKKTEQIKKEQNNRTQGNLHPSTYNDSIGFLKRRFFVEKIQNQPTFPKFNKQKQDTFIDLSYIRNTYTDQNSLSKKMFALMRQRKSTKILKAKLFSQLSDKNLQLNQQQKQNFTRNKHEKKISFERFNESPYIKLKGDVFVPFYCRSSLNLIDQNRKMPQNFNSINQRSAINFRQKQINRKQKKNILADLKQRISILDEKDKINDFTPRMFGTNSKLLMSSDKKFRLPHFNQRE